MRGNPQLQAIAFLVQKFGDPIQHGYEVHVSALEMASMSLHGTFVDVPDPDGRGVRWQYFPNKVLDLKPGDWWESAADVTPGAIEKKE